jgi:phosphoserine phosphatase RsbU/P
LSHSIQHKRVIRDLKLSVLLDVTKAINSNLSTTELLEIYEDTLKNKLNIGKLVLFLNDGGEWKKLCQYGIDKEVSMSIVNQLQSINEISTAQMHGDVLDKAFEIIIPVFHKEHALAYVLIGDLDNDRLEVSPAIKHLPYIQTITNIIIVAIENKQLARKAIQQAAYQKELELASEMQQMLFPDNLPFNKEIHADAMYLPFDTVGGDYYDYFEINEDEVMFCMADVSGKGIAAALLMSNFQANLKVLGPVVKNLDELIEILNSKVEKSSKGEKFITFFLGRFNKKTRRLSYVNAGHNPPILFNGDDVLLLEKGSYGLGMMEEMGQIVIGNTVLKSESIIVCYTDGIVDAENEANEFFGPERLQKLVTDFKSLAVNDINKTILLNVTEFKGPKSFNDDFTLLTIKFY